MTSPEHKAIRPPAVAGMFYPGEADELRAEINALIRRVKVKQSGRKVRGILAPHAGYAYSGFTAAHAYAMLCGAQFDTVVIVSPSHREFFEDVSVFPGEAYETPLGLVEIDSSLRDELAARASFIVVSDRGHRAEHALEVQLPFLQSVLPPFQLLPLVIGNQQPGLCFDLGEVLGRVMIGKNALLVASTDLSHFYSSEVANRLDGIVIDDVEAFDFEKLMDDLQSNRAEACGGGPAVAVMLALKRIGAKKMEVVHHANSGDITGDYSSVVGYLSAVAYN